MSERTFLNQLQELVGNSEQYAEKLKSAGPHVGQLRRIFGLSQAAMARATGLSASLLWKMEYGEMGLSVDSVLRVTIAFNVPVDKLLEGWGREEGEARDAKNKMTLLATTVVEGLQSQGLVPTPAPTSAFIITESWLEVQGGKLTLEQFKERMKMYAAPIPDVRDAWDEADERDS